MIKKIQIQQKIWGKKNFGEIPSWQPLLGISEEVGELSHHYLKRAQGIRNEEDHNAEIRDAVGDIFIYLCDFCSREGIDLAEVIEKTWGKVKKRDWVTNPDNAHIQP